MPGRIQPRHVGAAAPPPQIKDQQERIDHRIAVAKRPVAPRQAGIDARRLVRDGPGRAGTDAVLRRRIVAEPVAAPQPAIALAMHHARQLAQPFQRPGMAQWIGRQQPGLRVAERQIHQDRRRLGQRVARGRYQHRHPPLGVDRQKGRRPGLAGLDVDDPVLIGEIQLLKNDPHSQRTGGSGRE